MVDSSDIDNAVVAKLSADAALLALCPHGVYFDEAPQGSTRFVIVSLVEGVDNPVFDSDGIEETLYMIEPRALSTANGDVKAAAARIKALLHHQPLVVPGYTWMTMHKDGRPPGRVEVDEVDPSLRWLRRPAYYRVQLSVT